MINIDKIQLKELINNYMAKGSELPLDKITHEVRQNLGLSIDKNDELKRLIRENLSEDSDFSFSMKLSKSRSTEGGIVKVSKEMRIRRN